VPNVYKYGNLNLLEPCGPVIGLNRDYFTFAYGKWDSLASVIYTRQYATALMELASHREASG
jgi:hypothetical protein